MLIEYCAYRDTKAKQVQKIGKSIRYDTRGPIAHRAASRSGSTTCLLFSRWAQATSNAAPGAALGWKLPSQRYCASDRRLAAISTSHLFKLVE